MKQILLTLFFLNSLLVAEEPLQLYLCARLSPTALEWNNAITKEVESKFPLFRPQDIDLNNVPHSDIDYVIYEKDIEGMRQSDFLLVLPSYGRDCAWEIGWFCGEKKPTIAYTESEIEWMRDAMVKGGLTAVITSSPRIYELLLKDKQLKDKSHLISSRQLLAEKISEIIRDFKN